MFINERQLLLTGEAFDRGFTPQRVAFIVKFLFVYQLNRFAAFSILGTFAAVVGFQALFDVGCPTCIQACLLYTSRCV